MACLLAAAFVGSGPYSPDVQQAFINAFNRGRFASLVNPIPFSDIRPLTGSTGLIQEFTSKANSADKLALIKRDPAEPGSLTDTVQVYSDLYAAYLTAGVANAGLPLNDTTLCAEPPGGYLCNYQLFSKNYGLFVYSQPVSTIVKLADPEFSVWSSAGGVGSSLGIPTGPPGTVTSVSGTAGTRQPFAKGAIYSYPPNSATATTLSVSGAVYQEFSRFGHLILGFPTTEDIALPSGLHRQSFQGGKIEYTPGNRPVTVFPLSRILITGFGVGVSLKTGESVVLRLVAIDSQGDVAFGRTLNWSSSDVKVAVVAGDGDSAIVRATGSGQARIIVTGEGLTSAPLIVTVGAVCCEVGEGAPSGAISQSFVSALARNRVTVSLPNPTPVVTLGAGYVQVFSLTGNAAPIAVSQTGSSALAYVSGGSTYSAYIARGGFTGSLGFPASDAANGGTQFFSTGAALAGVPVLVVPAAIAAKWRQLGAESGFLGNPSSDAAAFTSASGGTGSRQSFAGGAVVSVGASPQTSSAFAVSGLILTRYLELGGPAGSMGVPLGDQGLRVGLPAQDFENGYLDVPTGSRVAVEHFNARVPKVGVTPTSVGPGGRVHVNISGFSPGVAFTVSSTGQANFVVPAPGGSFSWDISIPASAKPVSTTISARSANGTDVASASYSITSVAQLQPRLSVVSGDQQSGVPGAQLSAPLVAILRDSSGNPVPGVAVSYSVSPGASAVLPAFTDAEGRISGYLRLPLAPGVAVISVTAGGQVVSFSALSSARIIANFPPVAPSANFRTGLVSAAASLLRYQQIAGSLSVTNGLAASTLLNDYLLTNGGFGVSEVGSTIANLWAASRFAGAVVATETPTPDGIRDLISGGSPVLVILKLKSDAGVLGSAAVDAIGVNDDGTIAIADPNTGYSRARLSDYLQGFDGIQGTIANVVRFVPGSGVVRGFIVSTPLSAGSTTVPVAGTCAPPLDFFDGQNSGVRFVACDGLQDAYQIGLAAGKEGGLFDLASGRFQVFSPGASGGLQLTPTPDGFTFAPQSTSIAAAVNAADASSGLSPGGLFSIFGTGFVAGSAVSRVTINGVVAPVLASFPFQINAQVPPSVAAGSVSLQVEGPFGTAIRTVTVVPVSPGIFGLARGFAAVINQDGSINGPESPAQRGQFVSIYGTGLGAVAIRNGLATVTAPVSVVLNGSILTPSFAGLSPGSTGLYQVNVQIPAGTVPGTGIVSVTVSGKTSSPLSIAVQ